MDYFYVKPEDVGTHGITLRGDESKHLVRVMRKNIGDHVFITDGMDTMYETIISAIDKTSARCDITAMHRKYHESALELTLAVSLLKNPARFDFLVEKATELGVRTIIPLLCARTIPQSGKYSRLESIALASMKQCGRSWLPKIQPVQTFESFVSSSQHWPFKILPHEKLEYSQTIAGELKHSPDIHSVLLAIGPEGGFEEEEIEHSLKNGFKLVSLGIRRLRSETAALTALAQLL